MDPAVARLAAREIQLHRPSMGVLFHGLSMWPFLQEADELTVSPVSWEALRPGDIVVYRLDDRFPALRIVRKLPTRVVLRGDHWVYRDCDAWPEDILGLVVARRRSGRTLRHTDAEWRARAAWALADDRARRVKRSAVRLGRRIRGAVSRRISRRLPGRDLPDVVQVNIAASCNLGCVMCPYLPVHDDPAYVREMSDETFDRLLPALARVRHLIIAGAGEPLMNRRLPAFIDKARRANPSIEIALITNGTILTDAMLRELIDRRLDCLTVSIDGLTQDTVGAIRIGVNVEKVFARLDALAALMQQLGARLPVLRINYMVGYGNYRELPAFVRRARALKVKQIAILEIFDGTEASVRDNLRASLDRDGGATLRLAKRLADDAGIAMVMPTTAHDACYHPMTPHVAENGDVSPCCYMDYEGRTLFMDGTQVRMPAVSFGNVRDGGLEGAWRSDEYRALRTRNAQGDLPQPCRTCLAARVPTSIRVREVMG